MIKLIMRIVMTIIFTTMTSSLITHILLNFVTVLSFSYKIVKL